MNARLVAVNTVNARTTVDSSLRRQKNRAATPLILSALLVGMLNSSAFAQQQISTVGEPSSNPPIQIETDASLGSGVDVTVL